MHNFNYRTPYSINNATSKLSRGSSTEQTCDEISRENFEFNNAVIETEAAEHAGRLVRKKKNIPRM